MTRLWCWWINESWISMVCYPIKPVCVQNPKKDVWMGGKLIWVAQTSVILIFSFVDCTRKLVKCSECKQNYLPLKKGIMPAVGKIFRARRAVVRRQFYPWLVEKSVHSNHIKSTTRQSDQLRARQFYTLADTRSTFACLIVRLLIITLPGCAGFLFDQYSYVDCRMDLFALLIFIITLYRLWDCLRKINSFIVSLFFGGLFTWSMRL